MGFMDQNFFVLFDISPYTARDYSINQTDIQYEHIESAHTKGFILSSPKCTFK